MCVGGMVGGGMGGCIAGGMAGGIGLAVVCCGTAGGGILGGRGGKGGGTDCMLVEATGCPCNWPAGRGALGWNRSGTNDGGGGGGNRAKLCSCGLARCEPAAPTPPHASACCPCGCIPGKSCAGSGGGGGARTGASTALHSLPRSAGSSPSSISSISPSCIADASHRRVPGHAGRVGAATGGDWRRLAATGGDWRRARRAARAARPRPTPSTPAPDPPRPPRRPARPAWHCGAAPVRSRSAAVWRF